MRLLAVSVGLAMAVVIGLSPLADAASSSGSTYRVESGDTLSTIAARFHTSWETLAQLNHLARPNALRPGQILKLPTATAKPAAVAATARYQVRAGDTLESIAQQFHTTWQKLASINHMANPGQLSVGQMLVVPGSAAGEIAAPASNSASPPLASPSETLDQAIVFTAMQNLGIPYRWGGTSPVTGFDCSGLIQYVLAQNGLNIGRTSWDQYQAVVKVARTNLVPGDLVFFNTYATGPSHVGIYIGAYPRLGYQQAFIDAPAPGQVVMVQSLNNVYWASHYYGAGSVVP